MVSAKDFVQQVWIPLLEGWGYIYGTAGRLWTEALQKAWSAPPHKNWEKTKQYGDRWIGKRVTDCSGLPLWALKQLGEEIVHHARYQYTDASKAKGKLVKTSSVGSADTFPRGEGSCGVMRDDGKPLLPGTAVFLQGSQEHIHHVGVYVGHGICIEAKGTQWGVVTSAPDHWDHWGELKVVDYTKAADIENEPIPEVPEHREDNDVLFRVIVDNPGEWLNVRSGPGTGYSRLFKVEKGDVADVLAVSDDKKWDQIRYKGQIGWASAEYLSVVADAPDEKPEESENLIMEKINEAYDKIDELLTILDEARTLVHDMEDMNK